MLCFVWVGWPTVDYEQHISWEFFLGKVFARNLLRRSRRRNIFFIFRFIRVVWPRVWTVASCLISQHTTHKTTATWIYCQLYLLKFIPGFYFYQDICDTVPDIHTYLFNTKVDKTVHFCFFVCFLSLFTINSRFWLLMGLHLKCYMCRQKYKTSNCGCTSWKLIPNMCIGICHIMHVYTYMYVIMWHVNLNLFSINFV